MERSGPRVYAGNPNIVETFDNPLHTSMEITIQTTKDGKKKIE